MTASKKKKKNVPQKTKEFLLPTTKKENSPLAYRYDTLHSN